ncbi:serine hydrolase domain-containing protein [Altericroceibacterium endophyticum]|uniref:Serine hydrolase n=1 Tax=Altericroceibacterium endophyticum TaxID=1808508 RepID=A0A6I4T4Z9_9SPHN|nr:serine hydrolase [Altericroceibacterium endophyticum]MXO65282.1 serine hydrolase [Altericroceibacterium endophyticum]
MYERKRMYGAGRAALLAATAALSLACTGTAFAQDSTDSAASEPTPAIQELRRIFMNDSINALTFHSIDSIFHTLPVKAGKNVSPLSRDEHPLNFTYDFQGETYTPEQFLERTYTNALLVMKEGDIIYENYRNFTGPDTHFLSMSMAKSITSILVGAALEDGYIKSLDDTVETYVPELIGTAYEGATVEDLLEMKSGANRPDSYRPEPGTPSAKLREEILVYNRRRIVEEAFTVDKIAEPGTIFQYSTLNTNLLGWILEKATGKPIDQYMSERVWIPLGAQADGFFLTDGPPGVGRSTNGMGFNATLRDYARLGQMMLHEGHVGDRQIISPEWVRTSTVTTGPEPVSADEHWGYRYQWWTLADSNAYMALGLQGQFIYVDPDTETVVVKLSYLPLATAEAGYLESDAFFRAVSDWEPAKP